MVDTASKTSHVKSLKNERLKMHTEFDSQLRAEYVYEAPINAVEGTPCLRTRLVYRTPTSTQVKSYIEEQSTWQIAWDADFA